MIKSVLIAISFLFIVGCLPIGKTIKTGKEVPAPKGYVEMQKRI